VEVPLLLQFSIALFTGMVAATFVPPVRKAIPRPVELCMWIALITTCALGVTSVTDANARELSASALWGVDQVLNTVAGLLLGGAGAWTADHRFMIATWLVIVAGADLFMLMLLRSLREAAPWQPRVRLREWMELPVPAPRAPATQPVLADPLAGINRRLAGAGAVLGSSMRARGAGLSGRARDAMQAHRLSRFADEGRARSRARLESLRDSGDHFQFAARSWYSAAGRPAIAGAAQRWSGVMGGRRATRAPGEAGLRPGQVIDIEALLSAQSIGWYGPLSDVPAQPTRRENDGAEPQRPDSLAS
jgi:hypothetical protein